MMTEPKILVCVVSHNGAQKVKNCIESILTKKAGIGFDLLVIDSETNKTDDLIYLTELKARGVEVVRKDPSRFDTGGFWLAWKLKKPDYDYFLFIQDDIVVMENDWVKRIYDMYLEKIGDFGLLALGTIKCNWAPDHVEYVERITKNNADPEQHYAWGCVAMYSKKYLQAIEDWGLMRPENEPTNKMECEAHEIITGSMCKILGGKIDSIMGFVGGAIRPEHYKPGAILLHDITLRTEHS